jgi:hypothetical protein
VYLSSAAGDHYNLSSNLVRRILPLFYLLISQRLHRPEYYSPTSHFSRNPSFFRDLSELCLFSVFRAEVSFQHSFLKPLPGFIFYF